MNRRLNIGCGPSYRDGWVNLDSHKGDGVVADCYADVRAMPFDDHSFEQVYAGHVLEHIAWATVPRALDEVYRVMARRGELCVVGPDVLRLPDPCDDALYERTMWGTRRYAGDGHLWPSSHRVVGDLLCRAGFVFVISRPVYDARLDVWKIPDRDNPAQFVITAERP